MVEDQNESQTVKRIYANDNICTDCDGNDNLSIFDIDSGTCVYKLITRQHTLEAVEEGSSEEDRNSDESQLSEKPAGPELDGLHDLHSKIDEYQLILKHGNTFGHLPLAWISEA